MTDCIYWVKIFSGFLYFSLFLFFYFFLFANTGTVEEDLSWSCPGYSGSEARVKWTERKLPEENSHLRVQMRFCEWYWSKWASKFERPVTMWRKCNLSSYLKVEAGLGFPSNELEKFFSSLMLFVIFWVNYKFNI